MRYPLLIGLLAVGFAAGSAAAKEHSYEKGKVVSMDSVPCGTSEKSARTVAGELLGTDDDHAKTEQVLCHEYVIQSKHVLYHVRPEDTKHPALLPISEDAEYRIEKGKMMLRVPESGDDKEHSYSVVSMKPLDADQKSVAADH